MKKCTRIIFFLFVVSQFILVANCEENNEKNNDNKEEKPGMSSGIFKKIIPSPIKNLFSKSESPNDLPSSTSEKAETTTEDNKEHGRFDNIGRDIINGLTKTIGKLEEQVGYKASDESRGLDSNKTFFGGAADGFKNRIKAIYPGTQWCGGGNKARDIDDLGEFAKTDACCREHDLCPDSIDAGSTKYGLKNTGLFTRSNCECDQKFYDCLKKSRSLISTKIGHTYFTILGPQCFKRDHKIINCAKSKLGKCSEYELERSGEQLYQWFDSPVF